MKRFVLQVSLKEKKVRGAEPKIIYFSLPFGHIGKARRWVNINNKRYRRIFGEGEKPFSVVPQIPESRAKMYGQKFKQLELEALLQELGYK